VVGFLEAYWITLETALRFSSYTRKPQVLAIPEWDYLNTYPPEREIYRRIDSGVNPNEADAVARGMFVDIISMCRDECGARVLGKLFARCSPSIRVEMLQLIGPFFASIACDEYGALATDR
jgi:hypothetical protein